jgi:CRP-like cAMP-binding protein
MVQSASLRPRNHLLSSLSSDDFALVEPHLQPIALGLRMVMEESNKPIKHAYFPDSGFASVVANSSSGRQIEVGIIGREGMTGINVVMGSDRSPHSTYVQSSGDGHRMTADNLRRAMKASQTLRDYFLLFSQAFMFQTSHTALANGQAKIEERLARWLLMAHDRLDGDELPLTHEFLALMLSVGRPGVTLAIHQLESRGLITKTRDLIHVKDRAGLRKVANGLYGIPEDEYQRLIGWPTKH